ncbi:MAG TPA: hypothetical protein PLA12_10035 [Candidatus Hydrogenedens sp.]|nr:hypothetical protein [Candidatus Hydrogenedens sp.]
MFPYNHFKLLIVNGAIVLFFLCSLSVFGDMRNPDLYANPDEITIHDLNQESIVKIFYKNQLLKKEHIKNWSFLAGENKYNHMIHLQVLDDKIIITPALLETGTYDLVIETTFGKCLIAVYAPLDKLPDTLENRAQKEGISVEELKKRLGLVSPVHKIDIHLEVPPLHYEGQTLEINLERSPDLLYVWRVNNQVIKQGEGESSFVFTFPEPGNYTIEVEEKDADILLGKATAQTKVVSYNPIPFQVKMKQPLKLTAVEGYSSYIWKVDGVVQKESKNTITLKFNAEKKYIVECIAKGPKDGNPQSFFRTIYEVTVSR